MDYEELEKKYRGSAEQNSGGKQVKLIAVVLLAVVTCVAIVYFYYGGSEKKLNYNVSLQVLTLNETCSAKPAILLKYGLNLESNGVPIRTAGVVERVYNSENTPEGFAGTMFNFDESGKVWKNDIVYCLNPGKYYSKIAINATVNGAVIEKEVIKEFEVEV